MSTQNKRILVAVRPQDLRAASKALGSDFDLVFCSSFAQARTLLDEDIDLIACGLHFDEGRMFDFLRYAKAHPQAGSVPFFCVAGMDGALSPAMLKGIATATVALGAQGFVNFARWQRESGEDAACRRLHDAASQFLAGQSRNAERGHAAGAHRR